MSPSTAVSAAILPSPSCDAHFYLNPSDFVNAAQANRLTPLTLKQSWLSRKEPDFRPAKVWFGWTSDLFMIEAEMTDDDVYNTCHTFNEQAFLHGDVFEIFVHPANSQSYYEVHTTPDGTLLQLKFPFGWKDAQLRNVAEKITAPVCEANPSLTEKGWRVLLAIPFALLESKPKAGDTWNISASRYDYTHGHRHAVLSSSSHLPTRDFHLLNYFNQINFRPALGPAHIGSPAIKP